MKIKVKELKPNPFKKGISKGKLNNEQVIKIKANLKKLGFFGSIPVFKKGEEWFIIAGHHRVQALKEEFGKDYEVNVDVKQYDEDQIFRGMVIENLTHRSGDYRELTENINATRSYLNEHQDILKGVRTDSVRASLDKKGRKNIGSLAKEQYKNKTTGNDIAEYRLRVERKKREWLGDNVQQGGDKKSDDYKSKSMDSTLILKDIGITRDESSKVQRKVYFSTCIQINNL